MQALLNGSLIRTLMVALVLLNCPQLLSAPLTYRTAVMAALDERAIEYQDVEMRDGCQPDPSDCFALNVRVGTVSESIAGWIACKGYHDDCALWLPALDIRGVPLPAPAPDSIWLKVCTTVVALFQ